MFKSILLFQDKISIRALHVDANKIWFVLIIQDLVIMICGKQKVEKITV
jgi:hypothetical protein